MVICWIIATISTVAILVIARAFGAQTDAIDGYVIFFLEYLVLRDIFKEDRR